MKRFTFIKTIILCGIFFTTLLPIHSFAATAEDVRQQINNVNTQIQTLDKEIKQYQDQIASTNEQKISLANLIKELTLTRAKLIKEKRQTEIKIKATNLAVYELSQDIDIKQQSINRSKESLSKTLRDLNRSDQVNMIEKLLAQDSISTASIEYNNILSINEGVRQHILDIKEEERILQESKNKKVSEQQKLNTLKKSLIQKQTAVDITKKEKDKLLVETKNKESNYKKLLVEQQKKRAAFEKDLRNFESKLQFILNPNLLPTPGSGVLAWPLDNVFITQLFGKTISAKRLYRSGSHSGVDFRASIGTEVKAMADGIVLGSGDTDDYCKGASFGKWVFIKYENGLSSTFGHLSLISATTGQKVKAGDVVALSGNTGYSTAPHLHVTVYASQGVRVATVPSISCNGKTFLMPIAPINAYLDPMLYLPRIALSQIKNHTIRD